MAAARSSSALMEEYRGRFLSGGKMAQALRELVEEIDYWGHLLTENKDARDKDVVKWKFGNVESLIGSIADFEEDPDIVRPSLFDYLARVSLASRDDLEPEETGGRVNLMTIHSAKGLEFPVVFVAAVEKDIIPHARSDGGSGCQRGGGAQAVLRGADPGTEAPFPHLLRVAAAHGKARRGVPLPLPRRAAAGVPHLDWPRTADFVPDFAGRLEEDRRGVMEKRGALRRAFLSFVLPGPTCTPGAYGCGRDAAAS